MNIIIKKVTIGGCVIIALAMGTLFLVDMFYKSAAKEAILEMLKDPGSAIFGEYTKIGDEACFGVNAKNAMGGYVGQQQARLVRSNGNWSVRSFEEVGHNQCVTELKDRESASASMSELCKGHYQIIERSREAGRDTARLEELGRNIGCRLP